MITTRLLRHMSAVRCLRLLQSGRSMSRADMARELGQTRATIGHAVTELVQAGHVVEAPEGDPEARIGRPSIAVSLNPQAASFVDIDIGTRVITCVLVDLRLGVVAEVVEPTGDRFREPDQMVERLFDAKLALLAKASVTDPRIEDVAVSVPGLVDRDGQVVNAPFLEWRDVPLRQRLVERCPKAWRVEVCNDAFAFANAEIAVMDNPGREFMLMVLLAGGIGSAIVDNGKLVTGARGYSGELGHMVTSSEGRTDSFELLAGAKALAPLIALDRRVDEGVAEILGRTEEDEVQQALDRWARALAVGLANAIHLLDPGQIVLGGPAGGAVPRGRRPGRRRARVHDARGRCPSRSASPPSAPTAPPRPSGRRSSPCPIFRRRPTSWPDRADLPDPQDGWVGRSARPSACIASLTAGSPASARYWG